MLEIVYVTLLAGFLLAGVGRFARRGWQRLNWKDGWHTFRGWRIRMERRKGPSGTSPYTFRFQLELN